jgi:hypothetical protein
VVQGPDTASQGKCDLQAQAYIADGAIAGYPDGTYYLEIACPSGRAPACNSKPPVRSTAQVTR